MKIIVTSPKTYTVQAYQNGSLVAETKVNSLTEANQIATEYEQKFGEYSTTIKFGG